MNVLPKTISRFAALLLFFAIGCRAANYLPAPFSPPVVPREFRGMWIASVANIDWPQPGSTTAQQKAELISLLNRAQQLKLNAIFFQVRAACDAMYPSQFEPWSEYLTGVMGKAPEPYYDPLAFAIEEAHKRGMELHAWFNPYRALHKSHQGKVSANHISRTRPDLVRSYGEYLWLDPGERDVQDYSLKVVMDVVKRYDVDGVVFDDYFYPDPTGVNRDFPDQASWEKFGAGGTLSRDDWRRENVNTFISRVYTSIKAAKPWVKFGISPPGIWRPGNPAQIKGSDNYAKFFADSRKWLVNGWVDYFVPQLYWPIEDREHSFAVLLQWWDQQNAKGRHIWPGLAAYRSGAWPSNELARQVNCERAQSGSKGFLVYSATNMMGNSSFTHSLEQETTALVPASPWLGSGAPPKPNLTVSDAPGGVRCEWNSGSTNSVVRWWILQSKVYVEWKTEVLPGNVMSKVLSGAPEVISVIAIDRVGNASAPCVLQVWRNPAQERILLKQ
jgi:uncharacterized lipoprotein YddW (UPF0748 family)